MCHNEYDANRALSVRQAPRAPIVRRKRTATSLTPAGVFWLHYFAGLAFLCALAYFFW